MKILIFGASGSGTTTLAKEIGKKTDFIHLDVDGYYWKKTTPPFLEKIPLVDRNKNLKTDFATHKNAIVSGSMVSWGKAWETAFDLAVFIYMDSKKRIERLEKREVERYGDQLVTDQKIKHNSKAFIAWAKQYENSRFKGRSLKIHNDWIKLLDCTILRLDGNMPLLEKTESVMTQIMTMQ